MVCVIKAFMKVPWNKGKKFPYKPNPKLKGRITWNKGKKGLQTAWNKGNPLSEEIKKKISMAKKGIKLTIISGEKHYGWSVNPSYKAIHLWLNRYKQKPEYNLCQICFNTKKKLHAALLGEIYTRNQDDYLYMCPQCHGLYDS